METAASLGGGVGVWIALAALIVSAATLIAGAISMNNKARTTYVDFIKNELEIQRDRLESMGKEHEGLKRDLAKCVEDCARKDERINELMTENRNLLLELALGPRIKDMRRQQPEGGAG